MKANRAYRLHITRGGREPAFLASRDRRDTVEVVDFDDGEPILFWELPARDASKLARRLRSDLVGLQAEEFIALWEGADEPPR